ncbi:MAG TPA: bifunctional phosphopantothenoylcysteine decarboxylase/phosphopantothenate--cysteine ligase CoaBC [Enteractinococcus helveticum]|uniref:Coenzyme A biosynthesis bifunctional protein CoaBC n=1 Tax=Enteractinococcus helveticum TaxID=1837282 RepID=A0A921FNQ2_9MICC|nr:bifunctional phosphopantothenoylcysteine decarboxylase/phosphopantothenate--cysteine ligase CoaBC [Enteractinococcus helveticum]HJF14111.1 bifunctional phosphopantothenoylcysteine decarboxylase/phosphopantothenate--cysteine ligase CoaBC [Enteractinococcus helveticum]
MRIVLGVTGGIAAYKAALLLRLMTEDGHEVHVVPTDSALKFVGKPTWEALSGRPVYNDTFEAVEDVNHVLQGRRADVVVLAPATANSIAKAAAGLAEDLLGNILLTATVPVVMAPAMHTEMWENPATKANVATLRTRGVHVIEPAVGRLTGVDTGKGRFPEPEDIWAQTQQIVAETQTGDQLAGRSVVVSAGGTREALDPVRYLGNRSSGKQGVALAKAAAAQGARVTLIAGAMDVQAPTHPNITVVRIESTRDLLDAVLEHAQHQDALIMAAAVADFRPATATNEKIKKHDDATAPTIVLEQTEDVLRTSIEQRAAGQPLPRVIVGFAAETGDETTSPLEYGRAKLQRKGCEILVVNEVGIGKVFGQDDNDVTILFANSHEEVSVRGSKDVVAKAIIEQVAAALA